MRKFEHVLHTRGDGYWSNVSRFVKTTKINLAYLNEEKDFGELRVYFDSRTWDNEKHGLIYTDSQFLRELERELNAEGLNGSDVDYSEQGMQGDNYVSLDVGKKFIQSWYGDKND